MNNDFTPLDPDEGPTVWVRQLDDNQYIVEVVVGMDPSDELDSIRLSYGEIERLNEFIQSR